ncbi:MAG: hypothetical protein HDR11_03960 [Lachnospiraceae bacterium]|nr:hypothetical protein [Lachnospiraceae bacterium]
MESMWNWVLTQYKGYIGTGMIAGLFLVALVWLFVSEKNKNTRIVFIYVPVVVLILFFCPLFAKVVHAFTGEEIYYRILWLVPVIPVLAYAAVKLMLQCAGKKRLIVGAALGGIIILSGSLVYESPYFSKAENRYHVPEAVVKICDTIEVKGEWVWAAFPEELIPFVRQYSPWINMPYGREMLISRWSVWGFKSELYDLLQEETLNVERIAELAREQNCDYVVFAEGKKLSGSFESYGFELLDVICGYAVYADSGL